jgi:hypothetical protein
MKSYFNRGKSMNNQRYNHIFNPLKDKSNSDKSSIGVFGFNNTNYGGGYDSNFT